VTLPSPVASIVLLTTLRAPSGVTRIAAVNAVTTVVLTFSVPHPQVKFEDPSSDAELATHRKLRNYRLRPRSS
jgi:hypothetical protein